jgi:hypothetical protein
MVPQKLNATGHREPPSPEHPEQKTKSFPVQDANANKTFFGPAGLLKGGGSGRNKTGLNVNVKPTGDAGRFQKARSRRK